MPTGEAKPQVALLGAVPADVWEAMEAEFDLIGPDRWRGMPPNLRAGITRALTSAMGGADPKHLAHLPGLRRIASVGAGVDRFDPEGLAARGIDLRPTPEVMTEDTADCAIALMFACLRHVVSNDRFVRSGAWATGHAPLGLRLSAARVGIVGLGRIGGRIATKLAAFGCPVAYTGRSQKPVSFRFEPDLLRLTAASDVLILSCSGGEETRHLVDARLLQALGPDGFLINVSRGSVVDEEALIAALTDRRIAGAALDVFAAEPNPDPRFLTLDNCVLSPHAAVYTRQNRADLIRRIRALLQFAD